MNTQEMKSQILNGILSSTPSIIINGVEVKLPTPQRAGTNTQMRAYAEMKTGEILDQLKDANDNHTSTINFMYFAYNYPPNWIFKVWRQDTNLCNHLLAKMRGYSGNGTENFFKFFMQLSDGNKAKLCKWIDANYHNGDVKPSVTNEIDRAQLVLRWDNTSIRDDSTNFAVSHNDEQVAYGRLNNETNWAHVTMTLSEDVDDEHDLEGYLVKAIEQRTIRVV